jgi:hypothetical protein
MTDDAIKDFFLDLLISANKKEDEEVLLSFPQHFSAIQV